MQHSLFQLF
uniref:Uncharacterized protein n=1 Tax=Arundo donax TaxID=35708 RepID=A0A0A9CLA2_ARUDO